MVSFKKVPMLPVNKWDMTMEKLLANLKHSKHVKMEIKTSVSAKELKLKKRMLNVQIKKN